LGQTLPWRKRISRWKQTYPLIVPSSNTTLSPQEVITTVNNIAKNAFFTTDVGQHQMWSAQFLQCHARQWASSAGLGTMGYGLPAAVGVQIAHPEKLVVDIAGEASVLMTMQEMSTAVQYNLPIKIFILNNQYMGMVRQWQELLHEKNYSESYSEALPDFLKMAEAYGCKGIKAENPSELDEKIQEMLDYKGPVIFDCHVDPNEN
jgi:acetolactate synthase-1/2/3 large subunit